MSAPAKIKYQSTGRGGAGNYYQLKQAQKALLAEQSMKAAASSSSLNVGTFKSGIGGAGNHHTLSHLDLKSFAKDLIRARSTPRRESLSVGSGIGGAGNYSRSGSIASTTSSYLNKTTTNTTMNTTTNSTMNSTTNSTTDSK
jgi:hypothetical protein